MDACDQRAPSSRPAASAVRRSPRSSARENGDSAKHRAHRSASIDVADVRFGHVHPLPAGRADERVVVQRRDDRDPALARQPRQVEREIQQVVHVQDVGRVASSTCRSCALIRSEG